MWIVTFFSNSGAPAIGLSPTIRIRDVLDDSLLITDASMLEVGDGSYKYDFTAYDRDEDYSIRCDGGAGLSDSDRYTYAGNENYVDDVVDGTWSAALSAYPGPNAAAAVVNLLYGDYIHVDANSNWSGTTIFGLGTKARPLNNIGDAVTIANNRMIKKLMILSSVTVDADDDISQKAIETIGTMGITVTLTPGCSADGASFRNLNLTGTLSNGDVVLLNDCSVGTFEDFTGIMNVVSFLDGSEVSIGYWATIIQGTAGGEPTNEVEMSIGTGSLNISHWTGNLKLTDKTGTGRTVINCDSGNILIDSTCVSGSIQLLGIGQVESDDSGPNCKIDTDAFIGREAIAESVWDEDLVNHINPDTTGHSLMHLAYGGKIFVDPVNGSSAITVYPAGIRQEPVKTIADVLTLSATYDLATVHIIGSLTVSGGEDIGGLTFTSDRSIGNSLNLVNAVTTQTYFDNLTMLGTGNGRVRFTYCVIAGFNNLDGGIKNSLLVEDVFFTGAGNNYLTDVDTFTTSAGQYISLDVGTTLVNMIRCHGNYQISGKTGDNLTQIGMDAGDVFIDNTCTAGTIHVDGICDLIDNSAVGCTVESDHRISPDEITDQVWDEPLVDHIEGGSFGGELATKADIAASTSTTESVAITGTIMDGTLDAGSYVSTAVRDNTYWEIHEHAVDGLSVEMTFNIPDDDKAGVIKVFGRYIGVPSTTHYMELWAYNYEAVAWEQFIEIFLPGGHTSDAEYTHEYHERNIDRTNNNEVKIRLIHNVTTYIATHEMFLDYVGVTSIEIITAADIANAVWSEPTSGHVSDVTFGGLTQRIAGLIHENTYIDQPVYDSDTNLTSARVRIYSESASVGTASDVIGTYTITAPGDGAGKFTTWKMVKA